jgi:Sulfotransferase family
MNDSAIAEDICKFDEICAFNRRGLFVGGAAKSGTTLLLSLLDGHPKLAVLPEETHFFGRHKDFSSLKSYAAKARSLVESSDSDLRLLAEGRVEPSRDARNSADTRDYTSFDYPAFVRLVEHFAKQPWLNDSLIFSEIVRAYAIVNGCDWRNCVRWVEKTPGNEVYSDDLFKLFPDAKLLQIVRDPRAVFASRKRHLIGRYGRHTKAHRLVREWNESSGQISKLQKRTESYLLIRYEDLVHNTAKTLERVCRFIGIELLAVMLEPTRAGKGWRGNSAYDKTFGGISAASVDQWKKELTEDEIWWIEMHCREGMQIAGYNFETDCRFSFARWSKRMSGESWGGYLRARRGSLCQWAGLLEDCRYDTAPRGANSLL